MYGYIVSKLTLFSVSPEREGRGNQSKRLSQNLSLKSVTNRPPNVTYGRERGGVGGEEGCLQVLPLEEVMEVLAN